ncbi:MAG: DUF6272 family protein [Crocinitomicaceae bacterium]|nr:DUF6272 family protein [Crocinitomicaceae bacterium]MCF8445265.1 DUF6272 family protein [Crocinitomicaceae bacterium]
MEIIHSNEYLIIRSHFLADLARFQLENQKVIASYFGIIDSDFIDQFIDSLESLLIQRKIEKHRIKKLYAVALHSLNNMNIYGEKDTENQKLITFFITLKHDHFQVHASNLIEIDRLTFLTEYINEINSLQPEVIKENFDQALRSSFFSRGKNGIGIITMRHLSENRLKYRFLNVGSKQLFSLEMS